MLREDGIKAGYNDTKYGWENPSGCDPYAKARYISNMMDVLRSGKGHPAYNEGVKRFFRELFSSYGLDFDAALEGGSHG